MKKVLENKEIYNSIINLSVKAGFGLIVLDHKNIVVERSKSIEGLLDISNNRAINVNISDLINNNNSKRVEEILSGNEFEKSHIFSLFIKGEKRLLEFFFERVSNGNFRGTSILVKDITTKTSMEKDLGTSIEMVQNTFGHAPIGIFHVDNSGKIISANPELAWMLGYSSSELLVRNIKHVATQIFADADKADEFFFTLFEAEEVNRFRSKLKRSDGSDFWALSYAKASKNNDGRINGFYGFSIDITHTVRTEEKLTKLNEELKHISMIDGLTQIPNRRRFDEYIYQEWKRMRRNKKKLISMILCDVDYFKFYNDTYGHQKGDDCLKIVARAIKNCVKRPADLAARYGGEEFVILLPETDGEGAKHTAETIREAVKNLKIPNKGSKIDDYLTLSLGVGTIDDNISMTPDDLIKISDKALYRAKETGRNRVCEG